MIMSAYELLCLKLSGPSCN